jgi:hypothetical protein
VWCEVLYAKVLDSEIEIICAKSLRRKKGLYVGGMAVEWKMRESSTDNGFVHSPNHCSLRVKLIHLNTFTTFHPMKLELALLVLHLDVYRMYSLVGYKEPPTLRERCLRAEVVLRSKIATDI